MSTVSEKPAPTGNGLNRKTSRKGKKAWRKNVNIADIEENLSELRAEERTTGYRWLPLLEYNLDSLICLDT